MLGLLTFSQSHLSVLPNFNPIIIPASNSNHSCTTLTRLPVIRCSSQSATTSSSTDPYTASPPPLQRKKIKYRKLLPGEKEGITEEMRFVAMRLRKTDNKVVSSDVSSDSKSETHDDTNGENSDGETQTWRPSVNGFVKYLADSKLVFTTIERIVDESEDVSYAYFRNTGLERSESFTKDIEWFSQRDVVIPEPSKPGTTYVEYLEQLAETSPQLFLCHFYNIYFSHIAGGQVIAKQVSERLLQGRELEVCRWERDAEEQLKGVREKLNALGEHWTRDEKSRGLRESAKAFKFLGEIIRLIIL